MEENKFFSDEISEALNVFFDKKEEGKHFIKIFAKLKYEQHKSEENSHLNDLEYLLIKKFLKQVMKPYESYEEFEQSESEEIILCLQHFWSLIADSDFSDPVQQIIKSTLYSESVSE